MAIDDNTSYELTGAQVKDLASKIKAKADSSSLATVATSGNYNDLTNQPTIPTVNDATLTIQQNGTSVGTFTANASSNATISLTDTTYSAMTGASSGAAGTSGLVPAPAAGDEAKVLSGAGTWVNQPSGQEKAFYYVGYSNNVPPSPSSGVNLTLYSDADMTTTSTVQSMADDYFGGKEVHFCYIDTRGNYPIVDTIMTTGAQRYENSTTDPAFTFGSVFHAANYGSSGFLNGSGIKSGTTVKINYYVGPAVNDGTLTIQHNGTSKGTFTANQSSASTVNIETIYADAISPATAVDPITASMIAGGASPETLANGSVVEIVGTYAGDDQNYCLKYADGRLIAIIRKTFSNVSFSAWGSCYEHLFGIGWLGYYAVPFKYKPVVNCYATCNASVWACVDASNTENELLDKAPKVEIVRPSSSSSLSGAIHLIAYGFWK